MGLQTRIAVASQVLLVAEANTNADGRHGLANPDSGGQPGSAGYQSQTECKCAAWLANLNSGGQPGPAGWQRQAACTWAASVCKPKQRWPARLWWLSRPGRMQMGGMGLQTQTAVASQVLLPPQSPVASQTQTAVASQALLATKTKLNADARHGLANPHSGGQPGPAGWQSQTECR